MKFNKLRDIPILFLIAYVCVSHLLIPSFSKKEDVLFFYTWNLFSFETSDRIYDVTWDNKKTFVIRDHRNKVKAKGINLVKFVKKMSGGDRHLLKEYRNFFEEYAPCDKVKIVKIKSSLFQYLFFKGDVEIMEERSLCDD